MQSNTKMIKSNITQQIYFFLQQANLNILGVIDYR